MPGRLSATAFGLYCLLAAPAAYACSGTAPCIDAGTNALATANASIAVPKSGNPPTANPQSVSTNEDVQVAITLSGSDPESDPLTFAVATPPIHGILIGTGFNLSYTPNANFFGSDSFTYTAFDGTSTSAPATVSITVNNFDNDTPTATPQSVTTPEDTQKSITLTGSDIEGTPLTFSLGTAAANGTAVVNANGSATYTPNPSFARPDSFTFRVSDGNTTSAPATVSITVTNVDNDPPIATPQSVTTDEGQGVSTILVGTDPDSATQALTFAVASPPSNGVTVGTAPNISYTPNANFSGVDSFTFTANDTVHTSTPATYTITVTNIDNDPPSANAQSRTTPEDTPLAITLTGFDPESVPLTFAILVPPPNGTLSGTLPNLTYTPNASFARVDSFTFTVNDGTHTSTAATVSITVTNVDNDPPIATPQSATTTEGQSVSTILLGTDPDSASQTLTFAVASPPANGVTVGTPPNISYTPNANFSGIDSFTFTAHDTVHTSTPATYTITVTNVDNDPPIANAQSRTTPEGGPGVQTTLLGTDPDSASQTLTFAVASQPANGVTVGTPPNISYTPSANFSGVDSFTFTASDGTNTSTPATYTITVTNVDNDPPIANPQTRTTPEDVPVAVTLTGFDPESVPLTFAILVAPPNGTLSGTLPNLTYTPNPSFARVDSFTFTVNDGTHTSTAGTVSITVTNVDDDPPIANPQSVTTPEDQSVATQLSGTDPDSATQALTFAIASPPANGVIVGTGANRSFTPNASFSGTDSFTYTASDDTNTSTPATYTITVTNVDNDPPRANAQTVEAPEDALTAITLTGSDPEGDPMTFAVVAAPAHGTLSGTVPNLGYTPNANFSGADSFTFTTDDGPNTSTAATVSITVLNVDNDTPTANAQSVTTAEDTQKAFTLTGSDPENQALTFAIVTPPLHGALIGTGANLSFTPNANFFGDDSFTFTASDGNTTSAPATVSFTVTPVADTPVAVDDVVVTAEDTSISGNVGTNDTGLGDAPVVFTLGEGVDKGTLSLGTNGAFNYTPDPTISGLDAFTYVVTDVDGQSDTGSVSITINAVDDPLSAAPDSNAAAEGGVTATGNVLANDVLGDLPTTLTSAAQFATPITIGTAFTTTAGGSLTLNANGAYVYAPPPQGTVPPGGVVEVFNYTITDGDGDPASSALTINVSDNDFIAPTVTSIVMLDPNPTTSSPVRFQVNFSEPVNFADYDDFVTSATGTIRGIVIIQILGSGASRTITVAMLDGDGSMGLNLVDNDSIRDPAGNRLGGDGVDNGNFEGPLYTVLLGPPNTNIRPTARTDEFGLLITAPTLFVNAPGVLANDTDPDPQILNAALAVGPTTGILNFAANGGFNFTPPAPFMDSVTFTYATSDGVHASEPATVTVFPLIFKDGIESAPPEEAAELAKVIPLAGAGSGIDTLDLGRFADALTPEAWAAVTLVNGANQTVAAFELRQVANVEVRLALLDASGWHYGAWAPADSNALLGLRWLSLDGARIDRLGVEGASREIALTAPE